jgi:hypothetical protein
MPVQTRIAALGAALAVSLVPATALGAELTARKELAQVFAKARAWQADAVLVLSAGDTSIAVDGKTGAFLKRSVMGKD